MAGAMENTARQRDRNRAELGEAFDALHFVTGDQARQANDQRQALLAVAGDDIIFRHKRTKPAYRAISPGCELCGSGLWSCLFVNGKCNCRCFYCPAEQGRIGVPTTNTLPFPRVQDYVDYIARLGFGGVSISGGEPLLTPDITLKFIAAVRKRMGDRVYIWLYTNGTLADRDLLCRLRDAGLNEIRFDIGAAGYSLDKAGLAVGLMDHVTVEIPAVPEDYALMTGKLREMSQRGISFLNLHQLRLTPHNLPNMIRRPYTFLRGEHVTVLESELTALRLMAYAVENHLPLPVNYCSFVYKNRFQKAAARRRCGELASKGHEDVTENGYIRSLSVRGADAVVALAESLERSGAPADRWFRSKDGDRLFFSASLWKALDLTAVPVSVAYSDARLVPAVTYTHPFAEIPLNRKRTIFVERTRVSEEMEIPPDQSGFFERLALNGQAADDRPTGDGGLMDRLRAYELIQPDLQDYS